MTKTMSETKLETLFADPVAQKLLAASIPARIAYTGVDGSPRVVSVGFWWTGQHLEIATIPGSAKVAALHRDPRVAVTIDTEGFPPKVLLVRGTAEVEEVPGVPDGYVEMGRTFAGPDADQWEQGVRELYDSMTLIRITPTWAKILDFETRIPSAVAELVREKQGGGAVFDAR